MQLTRIYGFSVSPQRTSEDKTAPSGGSFKVTPEIRDALGKPMNTAKLPEQSIVDFRSDPKDDSGNRSHAIRSSIMSL